MTHKFWQIREQTPPVCREVYFWESTNNGDLCGIMELDKTSENYYFMISKLEF